MRVSPRPLPPPPSTTPHPLPSPQIPFNRRCEPAGMDPFWGNSEFPWHDDTLVVQATRGTALEGMLGGGAEKHSNDDSDNNPTNKRPSIISTPSTRPTHGRQASFAETPNPSPTKATPAKAANPAAAEEEAEGGGGLMSSLGKKEDT